MKRFTAWIFVIALMPVWAMAQPPEEVTPDVGTEAPGEEAPVPQPVAAPTPLPAPAVPEDKTMKGIQISPGVGIYPIGYDSINVGGAEGGRYFFSLWPSVAIDTAFKTGHGRVIDFSLSYDLIWREYFNKETTARDFEHDLYGSVTIQWTDLISTTLDGFFLYFFKTGADTNADNALLLDTEPTIWFQVMDNLKLKVAYWQRFLDLPDWRISFNEINEITDPPSDIDEFQRGGVLGSSSGGFSPFNSGFSSGFFGGTNPITLTNDTQAVWMTHHAAVLGARYSPPVKGMNVGLDYRFVFEGFSNLDSQEWRGHYLIPSFSQAMPWEGGKLKITDELRLRNYKHATVANSGGAARQNFRNRLTFDISQTINDYMGVKARYRLQLYGENKDDYNDIADNHWFYMGMTFSF